MKPGPKHGRFDEQDGPYLYRMAQLMDAEGVSAWQAANRVTDDALPGNSPYAKAKRLHSKFAQYKGRQPIKLVLLKLGMREIGRGWSRAIDVTRREISHARHEIELSANKHAVNRLSAKRRPRP